MRFRLVGDKLILHYTAGHTLLSLILISIQALKFEFLRMHPFEMVSKIMIMIKFRSLKITKSIIKTRQIFTIFIWIYENFLTEKLLRNIIIMYLYLWWHSTKILKIFQKLAFVQKNSMKSSNSREISDENQLIEAC